jgi:hypothetical protein
VIDTSFSADATTRAVFSACGKFRHSLTIVWDDALPILPWCLFNPSIAGQVGDGGKVKSDPTARKGRGFSQRRGFGGMVFVNPYDYIATKPKELRAAGYPVSRDNDRHILEACAMGDGRVVVAWGALGRGLSRPREVLAMIRKAGFQPMALGFTADGLPRHPLMLAYDTEMVEM